MHYFTLYGFPYQQHKIMANSSCSATASIIVADHGHIFKYEWSEPAAENLKGIHSPRRLVRYLELCWIFHSRCYSLLVLMRVMCS